MGIGINCDMGESFGLYRMGDDEALMPLIDQANIACGFHASDPNHMRQTVALAKKYDVAVGAHFSLPDLAGFGRREMKIDREEMANIILYQIGALTAFCRLEGVELAHLKPHGALYGMAARYEHIAEAVADAAIQYRVPVMGMVGTLHETVYRRRGVELQAEFFADLDYGDDGSLIITREHKAVPPDTAAARVRSAVRDGVISSCNGKRLEVRADTICIHSDTPNAADIARAVREAVHALNAE
jgi:5-oxoprolinase (ATP-hydrolysing) subunit A